MKSFQIKNLIQKQVSGEWGKEVVDGEGVKVIRTANFLATGKINFENIVHRSIDQRKIEQKKLMDGDILIEKSGGSPTQPVGRVVYFENPDGDTYLCNNFSSILRPNTEIVFPKYLFYSLLFNHKIGKTLRFQNKTTGIINLKLDSYLESKIPIPPIDDQTRIATLLSKVESLIARRKKSIADLEKLLKSTFLEMFGDPVRNEMGWVVKKLGEISKVQGGLQVTSKRKSNPIEMPYLRVANVYRDLLVLDEIKTIRVTKSEIERVLLKKGDILIVEGHGNPNEIGRSAVWDGSIEKCLHQNHLIRVRLFNEILPIYCSYYINSSAGRQQMFRAGKTTSGLNTISSGNVKDTLISIPPIIYQTQFAAIVEKVEALKEKYQDSLNDLETLYGALSQKAFKGELDLSRVPLAVALKAKDIITGKPEPGRPVLTVQDKPIKKPETREEILHQLFKTFLSSVKSKSISMDDFWLEAEEKFPDLMDEDAPSLGIADYDRVRDLLFEMLSSGKLAQVFNEEENRMEILTIP